MILNTKNNRWAFMAVWVAAACLILSSCNQSSRRTARNPGKTSPSTGAVYNFNEDDTTRFQVFRMPQEIVGPRLKYIQGGRAVLGSQEQDIMGFRDNAERTVTIASFYMDETEVTNVDYKEFLFNIAKNIRADSLQKLEPRENVWANDMSYNDVYNTYYFRYPGFIFYPVVVVSWIEANAYSRCITEYVNELSRARDEL